MGARAAASRSSSRKSGRAIAASASPRWSTVLPWSSATPYSVMTTSTWWRGVATTVAASNHGAIRERSSPPTVAVERRQISERAETESPGPETKSSWPPIPENWSPPIVSATTWPWMSSASAPLTVTARRFWPIMSGELTTSTVRKATSRSPSSHAETSSVPNAKVVTRRRLPWPERDAERVDRREQRRGGIGGEALCGHLPRCLPELARRRPCAPP